MNLGERAAHAGEVLGEDVGLPSVNVAITGHNTISSDLAIRHVPVFSECPRLLKRPLINQCVDALASVHFAPVFLSFNRVGAAHLNGFFPAGIKFRQLFYLYLIRH